MSSNTIRVRYAKWSVPAVGVVAGLAYLGIMLARGEPALGFAMLAIMLTYVAVVVLLRRRSETGALLGGGEADERQREIGVRAIAFTGQVLMLAILGGFFFTLATGSSAAAIWAGLAAVGGATFVAACIVLPRLG
ncbi:hypothetical protein P0W64_09760 [Tsukamurella sp. 8F]|uniref:hypothetical protein n=1 Tax=unclassified Tsukamurella TaxID=2633480 RepID=UPI0023B9867C|nr:MULTISPECIES: hypothetical protein [unclassified Tsukamurella]MDF0529865.1 hypothetical protein [Tsukamurella sp. 8J]MDF0587057.1 hypothetical protein [Tsukamurella sp. 8F]